MTKKNSQSGTVVDSTCFVITLIYDTPVRIWPLAQKIHGNIAQLVERHPVKVMVVGPNPAIPAKWPGDGTGIRASPKMMILRVQIPPGLQYGSVMQMEDMPLSESGFWEFKSPRTYKFGTIFVRILPWVALCRRYIRIERQNASVAQLEAGDRFRVYKVWVRIPPGVQT